MHMWTLQGGYGKLMRRPMRVGGAACCCAGAMHGGYAQCGSAQVTLRSSQAGMVPTLRFQSSYIALESSLLCLVGWGVAMWTTGML